MLTATTIILNHFYPLFNIQQLLQFCGHQPGADYPDGIDYNLKEAQISGKRSLIINNFREAKHDFVKLMDGKKGVFGRFYQVVIPPGHNP